MDLNPFDFSRPVGKMDDLFGSQELFEELRDHCREKSGQQAKNFLIVGKRKSGRTSFLNALKSTDIIKDYLPVYLKLEIGSERPVISLVEQFFNGIFQALIDNGVIRNDNLYFRSWRLQIDRGDVQVPIADELLRSGSRIALALNSSDMKVDFNSQILNHDFSALETMLADALPSTKGYFLIFDEWKSLSGQPEEVIDAFFRIINARNGGVALFATDVEQDRRSQRKSYYELLESRLSPDPCTLLLKPLSEFDIYQLINSAPEMKLLRTREKLNVSQLVRRAANGQPDLVKLFLFHVYADYRQTGNFILSSRVYKRVLEQIRITLSLESDRDLRTLENLRAKDKNLFLTACSIVLSTRTSWQGRGSIHAKSIEQILRLQHLPKPINEREFELELARLTGEIRQLWQLKLIQFVDEDGGSLTYSQNNSSYNVDGTSRPVSSADEMISSYIRVAAQEDGQKMNLTNAARSYLELASRGFILDLIKEMPIVLSDEKFESNFVLRSEKSEFLEEVENCLGRRISRSIDENSLTGVLRPDLSRLLQDAFVGNISPLKRAKGTKSWHLAVRVSEESMFEAVSFSVIFHTKATLSLMEIDSVLSRWRESNGKLLLDSYHLVMDEVLITEISPNLEDQFNFLLNRARRLDDYVEMFLEDNLKRLGSQILREATREIKLVESLSEDMLMALKWRSRAHETGFICAAVGEYALSRRYLNAAHKPEISQQIMIEDNKCVVDAYLGNLDNAVIHAKNVLNLLEATSIHGEYWKMIFSPLERSREIQGASSISIEVFDRIYYEVQLAILLMLVRKRRNLSDQEKSFLLELEDRMSGEKSKELRERSDPIHRLIAGYWFLAGKTEVAKQTLESMIERTDTYPPVQREAARHDLDEMISARS